MANTLADFRIGANVTAINGVTYTVANIESAVYQIRKKVYIVEDANGHRYRIPEDELYPAGKPAAELAIKIADKMVAIGDTLTFITENNLFRNYTLQKITAQTITIQNRLHTIEIPINEIKGISMVC